MCQIKPKRRKAGVDQIDYKYSRNGEKKPEKCVQAVLFCTSAKLAAIQFEQCAHGINEHKPNDIAEPYDPGKPKGGKQAVNQKIADKKDSVLPERKALQESVQIRNKQKQSYIASDKSILSGHHWKEAGEKRKK